MKDGRIELIIGPMFSGKTTELIRRARRYSLKGLDIIGFKYEDSSNNSITSHDNDFFKNVLKISELKLIIQSNEIISKYDIFLIDDLHFFSDVLEIIPILVNKYNKIVIAAGLDNNFNREPFINVLNLIPQCEELLKLKSFCKESEQLNGIFTVKDTNNKFRAISRNSLLKKKTGNFILIMGPMFSGKTTELISYGNKYTNIGKKVLAVNHCHDKRYSDGKICSHDKKLFNNTLSVKKLTILSEIYIDKLEESDVILIDELQFFDDTIDEVRFLVEDLGKTVIASGLDGDFMQRPFGDVCRLVSFADEVKKLSAVCVLSENYSEAPFTKRISNDRKQQLVGSSDKYISCSRNIFFMNDEEFLLRYEKLIKNYSRISSESSDISSPLESS